MSVVHPLVTNHGQYETQGNDNKLTRILEFERENDDTPRFAHARGSPRGSISPGRLAGGRVESATGGFGGFDDDGRACSGQRVFFATYEPLGSHGERAVE